MKEYLADDLRFRHVYVAGRSGYGKSALLHALAYRDIRAGKGVCVIDPKGDLAVSLLEWVHRERVADTIYLDGTENIPIRLMGWETPQEKRTLVNDLFAIIHRLCANEPGQRWPMVLRRAIQAVVECPDRSFTDINDIIEDDAVRNDIVRGLTTPKLIKFWSEFPKPYPFDVGLPVTTRLSAFIDDEHLATMLGNPDAKLRIADIIEQGKVLILNLGSFLTEQQNVIGSLIVSQIQQAIFRRAPLGEQQRQPFYLYCDEFQDFKSSTAALAEIVRKARGFKLSLTMANQHPKQITDLLDDIKGCVSTYFLFQMDADHARLLASQIRPYRPQDIEALPEFQALYRPPSGETKFITTRRYPNPNIKRPNHGSEIRVRTVQQYYTPLRQKSKSTLESKRDAPFKTNEGKTRGPKNPR